MRIEFNLSEHDPAVAPLRQAWREAGSDRATGLERRRLRDDAELRRRELERRRYTPEPATLARFGVR